MLKELVWHDEKYKVKPLKLKRTKEYFSLVKALGSNDDPEEQTDICIKMLSALNCPETIIDDLTVDEFEACLAALQTLHFPDTGESGNPKGGAQTR
ncbi:MAG: hypothetical protein GY906_18095 [bacterium]|nr:hypothetical protein [bacterium]